MYPPPANTLQTVTDPALFKYSCTVCGTNVSESRGPNLVSKSWKLLTTVGTKAGPFAVGPIIALLFVLYLGGENLNHFLS